MLFEDWRCLNWIKSFFLNSLPLKHRVHARHTSWCWKASSSLCLMSHSLAHQSVLSFIFLPRLSCGFLTPLCLSVFPSFYSATRQTPAVTLSAAGAFSIPVSPLFSLLTFTLSTLVLSLSLLSFLSPFLPLVNDSVGYTGFCFLSLLLGVMNVGAYIPSSGHSFFHLFFPFTVHF